MPVRALFEVERMQKFRPELDKYFNLPNPGLLALLAHNVSGNSEVYRTPFWSKGKPGDVLSKWQRIMDGSSLKRSLPELYAYEMDMKRVVGPMSVQLPLSDRIQDAENYYRLVVAAGKPISSYAVRAVQDEWCNATIRLRSQEKTVENMRLSTNSGSPYVMRRRLAVEKTVGCEPVDLYTTKYPNGKSYRNCAILGWRGQEGGPQPEDVKQRVVFMFPFGLNLMELQWYQPAIEHIQRFNHIPAYVNRESVDKQVTKLFDTKEDKDLVICTDFSKFDQHFNRNMQQASLEIQRAMMSDDEEMRRWQLLIYPQKYIIPLVCSGEVAFSGPHGMGSGSGGTNFDESMAHRALQHEAAQSIHAELNPYSQCLGDDGILSAPNLTVETVMRSYTSHGQEMNPLKQYASTHDCVYLRHWHGMAYRKHGICVGVYSTFRALGRLLYQERFFDPNVWSKELVTLRAWSVIENCRYHPLFEEFVDYCISGDKYRLGLSIPGFLDSVGKQLSEAEKEIPDFMGYTKTMRSDAADGGITNWAIYKYLKSKA